MKIVNIIPPPRTEKFYDIRVSQHELHLLAAVLDSIGGDPESTRGEYDQLYKALREHVEPRAVTAIQRKKRSSAASIYFD